MFLWKIKFSLQQKEGSNDLVGPKYYASSVGVPCCHCRMDKSFFKKALRYHTKKLFQDKILSGKYFSRKEWLNQIKQNRKKSLCQITDGQSVLRKPTTYIVTLHGVFRLFHMCRLAFSEQMLGEIGLLVQNARCPYCSEERDKPSTYENVKNTPNYNVQMRPST